MCRITQHPIIRNRPITDWHTVLNIPITPALNEPGLQSLYPITNYRHDKMFSGKPGSAFIPESVQT